jgi:hypothetical protein
MTHTCSDTTICIPKLPDRSFANAKYDAFAQSNTKDIKNTIADQNYVTQAVYFPQPPLITVKPKCQFKVIPDVNLSCNDMPGTKHQPAIRPVQPVTINSIDSMNSHAIMLSPPVNSSILGYEVVQGAHMY